MSGMLTVFFFARLWRRANVMTDVELAEIRYSGRPAAFLRGFRALYLAIPINLIILGWVTRAMIKILTISLGLRDVTLAGMTVSGEVVAVGICFVITVAYAVAAGMWAVLWTDLVQFVIKMTAVIVLAVLRGARGRRHRRAEGEARGALRQREGRALGPPGEPRRRTASHAYAWMPLLTLGVFLACSGGPRGTPAPSRAAAATSPSGSSRRRPSATACSRRCSSTSRTTRSGRGRGSSPGSRR